MHNYVLYRNAWRYNGPPHKETQLQKSEWKALLKKKGVLVRNTYDFDTPQETNFWYIIKDRFDDFEELSSNERNKVRRSFKSLVFKKISITKLRNEGWSILKETYEDYVVSDRKMNESVFLGFLSECEKKNSEYWGVFDQDTLIGFTTVWLWSDNCCEYGLMGIKPEYKHNNTYPYYGLFHTLNSHYLGERHFRYVADGARSITEHSHIQDFLIQNFNFRKAYCHLAIHYKWWVKLAVKILYPFRKIISIPQIKAVLNMESMTCK